MKTLLLPLVAGLILSGCGSSPETPAQSASPSATPTQVALAPGDAAKGKVVFEGTCVACHGAKGQGVANLGKPLVGSAMLNLSPRGDLVEAAANLFSFLRRLDETGTGAIAVMPIPHTGLGEAINDRLRRAAAPRPPVR